MSNNGKPEMIELTVNGQKVTAAAGKTVYEVVSEQGLDDIPVLCHSPYLQPYGSCFVCVVEVEGRPNLVPSCATKVQPGMVVTTRNERIEQSRKTALELLMSNHYADCVAPCVLACPAHVDVQGYIALAARGQFLEAADLIRKTNPLPAVCGRVCVRKCEGDCRRLLVDDAVAINDLKRYITDSPVAYDSWPERSAPTGKRVAIVGAGPTGLTAAYYLGLKGHEVTIFEMMPEPGGMLRYGIPEYRLTQETLAKEIDYITSRSGSEIQCNTKLGEDIHLDSLREEYDSVILAMGAMGANAMRVPGEEDTEGVLKGLDFLIEMAENPQPIKGIVVVVGGGNTAMDAARTARRLGADKVIVLYRRMREQMPADKLEVEASLEEDIALIELAAPQELITDDNGRLTGIKCIRMKLGEPDASGRRRPVPVEGSEFVQNCDWCVSAIGQSPILDGIDPESVDYPEVTKWQTLVADQTTYATRVPKVFACGDVETGPSVVIDCIAAGQRVSRAVDAFLSGIALDSGEVDFSDEHTLAEFNDHIAPHCDYKKPIIMRKDLLAEVNAADIGERPKLKRMKLPELEVDDRIDNFEEVSLGFGYGEASHEWPRCMSCGCIAADDCQLREYCSEYDVDLTKYAGDTRKYKVDDRHPYIVIDNNKCILCARCVRTCSQVLGESALSLVNRGFKAQILPAMDKPLVETACVSCGNCEAECPTGALSIKTPFPGRAVVPAEEVETTCGFCSLGCRVKAKLTSGGRFWLAAPDTPGPNGRSLCRFGRFGAELYMNVKRVTSPMEREGGEFKPTTFESAYNVIVEDMRRAVERYGPEAVGVFVSPEMTNEQMYVAQRIAREALGTNNITSLSNLLIEGVPDVLTPAFGFTASTADRSVLEQADVIVLNNSDLELEQLILSMQVTKALERGAKVIAVSGVHTELHEHAALNLEPMRGSSTVMWHGVKQKLVEKFERGEIEDVPGGEELLNHLDSVKISDVVAQTGETEEDLDACAEVLAGAKHVVFVHSPDRTEDHSPGDTVTLGNLMTLLSTAGKQVDLLLPRQASNAAGLETCGVAVEFKPGRQPVPDELLRVTPSRQTLLSRLKNGEIKAALILGEDPMRNNEIRGFLENLRFLAVMAETFNETAKAADVVLPATNYLEEPGTRVNFEGNVYEFESVIRPPAERPGWQVLAGLAGAFGLIGVSNTVETIREKLQQAVREGYGAYTPFYWNTGEQRRWRGPQSFQRVEVKAEQRRTAQYLTMIQRYKYDAATIGIKHFRMTQPESFRH